MTMAAETTGGATPAQLAEIQSTMRAMRRLRADPVPAELLEQLVQAATWAPTASNVQGFQFVIVTDRAQMARVAELWAVCVDVYLAWMVQAAPREADQGTMDRAMAAVREQRDRFAETPALIVACYDSSAYYGRVQRNVVGGVRGLRRLGLRRSVTFVRGMLAYRGRSEAASIYPGVQNLLLMARTLGLGATLTTWHLTIEADFKRVLGVPRHVHTYALIPVGWPVGTFGPVRRRPLAEVVHRDRWRLRSGRR
jgi:nitroreductase